MTSLRIKIVARFTD